MSTVSTTVSNKETIPTAPGPAIDSPLTLDHAIACALAYNLDASVKALESDIQKEAVAGARLKMIPSLTLDGEFSARDSYDASFSEPLFEQGGQAYNYSRDKTSKRFNAELSWDLLNFGIAYYQQRQTADQYVIAEQRRRRVLQNLKFDVTKAFWQVLAAKRSMEMAKGLVDRLKQREKVLQQQLDSRITSELESLQTSVVLSEMQMNMSGFENEFRRYKSKLATFMGVPASRDFDVAGSDFDSPAAKTVLDLSALEAETLRQRPELFEQDMEERITIDEARIAVARALPKASLFYRFSYDADSHLYYNEWHAAGVRLSFDLLSVPQQISRKREIGIKKTLVQTRRRAIAAAVLTQLRLAVIDFEDAQQMFRHAREIAAKRQLLMEARRRHAEFGNGDYEEVLESEAKYLFAQVRSLTSFAELMIAEQRILNTAGSDDIGKPRFLAIKSGSGTCKSRGAPAVRR